MNNMENLKMEIDLIKSKVEILKLKADDYNWCCHVPKDVKEELDKTLTKIDRYLSEISVIKD